MEATIGNEKYLITKTKKVPQGNVLETEINKHPFCIFMEDEEFTKKVK